MKTMEVKKKNMVEVVQRRGVGYQTAARFPDGSNCGITDPLGSDSRGQDPTHSHTCTSTRTERTMHKQAQSLWTVIKNMHHTASPGDHPGRCRTLPWG